MMESPSRKGVWLSCETRTDSSGRSDQTDPSDQTNRVARSATTQRTMTEPLTPENRSEFFAKALGFELSLGSVALVIGWIVGFNPLASLLPRPTDLATIGMGVLWGVVGTLPMLAGLILFDRYPIGPLKDLKALTERLVVPLFSELPVWQLAILSAAAGFGEEALFRGLLQAGLAHWLPLTHDEWLACFMASVMFGLCHWLSTTYGVLAILVGIYLGVLFLLTGSLLPPMIAHALYDLVALVYFVKRKG